MSANSLATDLVDTFLRSAINTQRAAFDPSQPALTNDQWNFIKPMYIAQIESMINGDFSWLAAVMQEVDALRADNIIIKAQVAACMLSTVAVTPPVPGWAPSGPTGADTNSAFTSVMSKLNS